MSGSDAGQASGIRAITVQQPWASLIASGRKTIELRTWPTRHRGPLLIHSASRVSPDLREYVDERLMPLSTMLAVVELADVRPSGPDDGPPACITERFWHEWWTPGAGLWSWELRNVRRLAWYPARGRQRLWKPDPELVAALTPLPRAIREEGR